MDIKNSSVASSSKSANSQMVVDCFHCGVKTKNPIQFANH